MAGRFGFSYTAPEKATIASAIADLQTTNNSKVIHLTPDERHNIRKMGPRTEGYVSLVMNGVDAQPSIAPGTFNLTLHHADRDIRAYLIDEKNKLLTQVEGLDNSIMMLGHNQIIDADVCAAAIIKGALTDQNLQGLANDIKAYRTQHAVDHPRITVPMNGSVLQEGIKKGTRLTNYGSTVLTVTKYRMVTGGIVVGPHDSTIIPDDWTAIDVKNGSTTSDGEFTI